MRTSLVVVSLATALLAAGEHTELAIRRGFRSAAPVPKQQQPHEHEESYAVDDYRADPVTQAYRNFYDSEEHRTCKKCGTIMPAPASL